MDDRFGRVLSNQKGVVFGCDGQKEDYNRDAKSETKDSDCRKEGKRMKIHFHDSDTLLMTEGPIGRQMITFAIPIFLGQLFQQLYNTVDTIIVGNLLGDHALSAVASSGNLIMLLVGFFNGMSMGASVVISQAFGAGKQKELTRTIHTSIALGLLLSIVLALLGRWLSPIILVWMQTPPEVLPLSNSYFEVYFTGIIGLVLYNIFSAILRAVGDSKHPLYFLMISSGLNVVMDLVFIAVFHWGVAGAAIATVISQAVSAILALRTLLKADGPHRVELTRLRIHWPQLKQIVRYGIPTGVQNSIISLANVVVQSNINSFGSLAMAGCGAYSKVEGFVFLPIMSFGMAISTFVGQNLGAGDTDRAKSGASFGVRCSCAAAEVVGVLFFLFAPSMIWLFDQNPEVIAFGALRAQTNALFYFLLAYSHAISAVCRGAGKPAVPMNVMLVCWCLIRVGFLWITAPFHNIAFVNWVYPMTWALSSIFFFWYSHRKNFLTSSILAAGKDESAKETADENVSSRPVAAPVLALEADDAADEENKETMLVLNSISRNEESSRSIWGGGGCRCVDGGRNLRPNPLDEN